jgi:hypothetical protein
MHRATDDDTVLLTWPTWIVALPGSVGNQVRVHSMYLLAERVRELAVAGRAESASPDPWRDSVGQAHSRPRRLEEGLRMRGDEIRSLCSFRAAIEERRFLLRDQELHQFPSLNTVLSSARRLLQIQEHLG